MSGRQLDGISQAVAWSSQLHNQSSLRFIMVDGPAGCPQLIGIFGQRAVRTSDRLRCYVLSRAIARMGQSPCTLFGAVRVP